MLLALVYGAFLLLTGGLATGLAVLVTAHFATAIINSSVAHDRVLVRLWADAHLSLSDTSTAEVAPERQAELVRRLGALVDRDGILHARVYLPGGALLAGYPPIDAPVPAGWTGFMDAAAGRAHSQLLERADDPLVAGDSPRLSVLRTFLPLMTRDGAVHGVVGLWRDGSPIVAQLAATRNDVLLLTSVATLLLAVMMLAIFRAAHRRLREQSEALIEAGRRDPLTGLLNHGAAVGALAERLDVAAAAGAPLATALVDIDNFRALNETHGYAVGDAALLTVAGQLAALAPAGALVGRYGPDEFLVIGPPMAVEAVDKLAEGLRGGLAGQRLDVEGVDPLPITVSVGLAAFPLAAHSVTDLLTAGATALGEAKVSGGDAVGRAGASGEQAGEAGSFTILQGLIFAVDTKDRYTRRHSEDVARYALFLGRRLALADPDLEMLRMAGLLHDVGKVGIPDAVLRKPGTLTADERRIVQQHVALGDLIVRDVPDLERVRAGVRYHHERWDGGGYLDGLAGDEIPLVARILAVADAFSAMTTTRPYRKALSVAEALRRLEDAAGTQLEERLVVEFVHALETSPDAPQPGDEALRQRLWTPSGAAA